jgi:hypothetical protein
MDHVHRNDRWHPEGVTVFDGDKHVRWFAPVCGREKIGYR